MGKLISRYLLVIIVVFGFAEISIAQRFTAEPIQVTRSTLFEQVKGLRLAKPEITGKDLALAANDLLDKNGIGYSISFDEVTCERLRLAKTKLKDQNAPLRLGAVLKSVDADGASLALPEPTFSALECGGCQIELPLLQITGTDFITLLSGRNVRFHRPTNFLTNTVALLDEKTPTTILKTWNVPFRSVPIGISYDANVLYIGFEDRALHDLALFIFSEGMLQFGTRSEAEEGGKGKIVSVGPGETANAVNRVIRFDRWQRSYTVGYSHPCPA